MKLHALRTLSGLALTIALTACGSGSQVDTVTQTAAVVTSSAAPAVVSNAVATVPSSTMPAPDCQAQGCAGLRIIDANAEAYRYEAMRRAAADQAANTTQS